MLDDFGELIGGYINKSRLTVRPRINSHDLYHKVLLSLLLSSCKIINVFED